MKRLFGFILVLFASNLNAGVYKAWENIKDLTLTPILRFSHPLYCSTSVYNLTTTYVGAGLGTITDPSNVLLLTETAIQLVGNGSVTGTWWNNGAAYFGDAVVCSSTVNLLGGVTITGLLTADSLASNGKTRVGRELTVGGYIITDSIGTQDDSLWIWSDDVIRFRDYDGFGAFRDGKTIHRYIYSDTFAVNGGTRIEVISPMDMNLNNLYFNGTDSAKIFNGGTNLDFSIKGTGWTIPLRIIPDTVQIWIAQFGGGYGTTGCDIQADGDIFTNGSITADGNATADTFIGYHRGWGDSAVYATTALNAVNTGITLDNASAADYYISWVTTTTGNLPQKVSSALTYNPSTGNLYSSNFSAGSFFTGDLDGTADNADSLANLTASQFLRSDVADTGTYIVLDSLKVLQAQFPGAGGSLWRIFKNLVTSDLEFYFGADYRMNIDSLGNVLVVGDITATSFIGNSDTFNVLRGEICDSAWACLGGIVRDSIWVMSIVDTIGVYDDAVRGEIRDTATVVWNDSIGTIYSAITDTTQAHLADIRDTIYTVIQNMDLSFDANITVDTIDTQGGVAILGLFWRGSTCANNPLSVIFRGDTAFVHCCEVDTTKARAEGYALTVYY
jgi:hypothetical protein